MHLMPSLKPGEIDRLWLRTAAAYRAVPTTPKKRYNASHRQTESNMEALILDLRVLSLRDVAVSGHARYKFPQIVKTTNLPNGLNLAYVSLEDMHFLYKEIFTRQAYLRHGLKLCSGDTVIDVGANVGLFSIFASGMIGEKVHLQPLTSVRAVYK